MHRSRLLAGLMALAVVVVGCTGASESTPSPSPAPPANPSGPAFQLAGPAQVFIGGITFARPACRPDEVAARAVTRPGAYGVLGVVRLRGTAFHHVTIAGHVERLRCSLHISHGPTALLGASGRALDVARSPGNPTNRPGNGRPDRQLTNGIAAWGFSWLGSYCGPPARAIRLRLRSGARISAPLTGPSTPCAGSSSSVLLDGVPGGPDEPVQPAPPQFGRLRLHLSPGPGTTRRKVADIAATLTTTGDDVVLSPCPSVDGTVSGFAHGGFRDQIVPFALDCVPGPTVVSRSRPLHFTVAGPQLTYARTRGADAHSKVTIQLALAGAPTATLVVAVP